MKQVKISAFHEWLNSDSDDSGLLDALRALTELVNPQSIIEAKGNPGDGVFGGSEGGWSGWN